VSAINRAKIINDDIISYTAINCIGSRSSNKKKETGLHPISFLFQTAVID